MKTVLLLRHGEIAGLGRERCYLGQLDPPLSERGREQMALLAHHPRLLPLRRILASPLRRSAESAAILSAAIPGCSVETMPALAEISLGQWEGLSFAEVRQRFPEDYRRRGLDLPCFRPPGGESFTDLQRRVWPVFQRAAEEPGTVALMAHAGVNRVLLCQILGMPLAHLFRLGQDYGCCSVVTVDDKGYRLAALNLTPADMADGR